MDCLCVLLGNSNCWRSWLAVVCVMAPFRENILCCKVLFHKVYICIIPILNSNTDYFFLYISDNNGHLNYFNPFILSTFYIFNVLKFCLKLDFWSQYWNCFYTLDIYFYFLFWSSSFISASSWLYLVTFSSCCPCCLLRVCLFMIYDFNFFFSLLIGQLIKNRNVLLNKIYVKPYWRGCINKRKIDTGKNHWLLNLNYSLSYFNIA